MYTVEIALIQQFSVSCFYFFLIKDKIVSIRKNSWKYFLAGRFFCNTSSKLTYTLLTLTTHTLLENLKRCKFATSYRTLYGCCIMLFMRNKRIVNPNKGSYFNEKGKLFGVNIMILILHLINFTNHVFYYTPFK